jgi:hypothetical protein
MSDARNATSAAGTPPRSPGVRADGSPWRPPTRRAFVAMLGAAAAALAVRTPTGLVAELEADEGEGTLRRRRRTGAPKTIWIGHC